MYALLSSASHVRFCNLIYNKSFTTINILSEFLEYRKYWYSLSKEKFRYFNFKYLSNNRKGLNNKTIVALVMFVVITDTTTTTSV